MQISAGRPFWNQIWFLEFNNSSKLFSKKKKKKNNPKTGFFWNDQYSSPCIPHLPETQNTNGWGLIMKTVFGPPNVIIKPPYSGDIGGVLETWWPFHGLQCLSHSARVWVEPPVKHKAVEEAERACPRTVAIGLRFKQSTRCALYLNRPQTPEYSLQFKQGLEQSGIVK